MRGETRPGAGPQVWGLVSVLLVWVSLRAAFEEAERDEGVDVARAATGDAPIL